MAYTDDIRRFKKAKQYCAYFGLTPRLDESGTTKHMGHISKQGPSVVRWLIGESAWRVVKQSPAMRHFLRMNHGRSAWKKIAIVAVDRKLLTVMRAMILNGEMYNEVLISRNTEATRPGNAFHVPPPPEKLMECMGQLENFLNNIPEKLPH